MEVCIEASQELLQMEEKNWTTHQSSLKDHIANHNMDFCRLTITGSVAFGGIKWGVADAE